MPHVPVPAELPGIISLFAFRPETAAPLSALAQQLLRGPSSLAPGERELIFAFSSSRNHTLFCQRSHAAAAAAVLGDRARVDRVIAEGPAGEADPKLRALLEIAEALVANPQGVTEALVAKARAAGADDVALHDAVLVAASACMYNRYVDGLASVTPDDEAAYAAMGRRLADEGYLKAGQVATPA